MASGLFAIGASGLAAAYTALQTTGHNIANVATPGYSRQTSVQSALTPQISEAGFVGKGVNVTAITRAYDELTSREVNRATSRAAEATTTSTYSARLDRLMGDSTTGVGTAMDSFFNNLQALTADPSSTGQRAAFLDEARNLASRFSDTISGINVLKDDTARELTLSLRSINEMGKQVAEMNGRISLATATGQTPNDLMDQRDSLVRSIAGEISVTTIPQNDGSVSLLVGNGQPLVVGNRANSLAAGANAADPTKVALTFVGPSGNVQLGTDGTVMGGKIAGLMNLHNRGLATAEAELGRLATAIATPLNNQHVRGLDLYGNSGGPLFSLSAPTAAGAMANTGNAHLSVAVTDSTKLKASDYQLGYDGTNYQLTRLSDGTKQTLAGLPATVEGFSITVASGAMAAGDVFTLKPVSTAAGDIKALITDPQKVAMALPVAANAAMTNAGNAAVQSLGLGAAADPNLLQPVTLTFTSANKFDVVGTGTGNPTGQTWTEGTPVTFNGWTLALTGTPRVGDKITIAPNGNLGGDNRNGMTMTGYASRGIVDGQPPAQSFAATLATIGGQARSAVLDARVQGSIRDDAIAAEQSFSGVNLDEEAANLMQYQQAYQAAAKVVAAAQAMFDSLLELGR